MPRTRLRADYRFGTVTDSPLTSGATTLNSAELADFPAVSANEVAVLTLHDPSTGTFEHVYVTAHTAAATSATIVRGREGSTAAEWASGSLWLHGPTQYDFPGTTIDAPWEGSLGYDEEFAGYSTSLPSGWSWLNQGSAGFTQEHGAGLISLPSGDTTQHRGIIRDIPSESTWSAYCKFSASTQSTGNTFAGMVLYDGTKLVSHNLIVNTGTMVAGGIEVTRWNSASSYSNNIFAAKVFHGTPTYLRITKNSATSWDFSASSDGVTWAKVVSANDVTTHLATPTKIGLTVGSNVGDGLPMAAFHWFRVR